jgi:hypothetical protein
MSKKKLRTISKQKIRQYTPVVVYFGAFFIGVIGYVIGRTALSAFPHPVHWASGLVGGVFGYFIGWGWYHWRCDII